MQAGSAAPRFKRLSELSGIPANEVGPLKQLEIGLVWGEFLLQKGFTPGQLRRVGYSPRALAIVRARARLDSSVSGVGGDVSGVSDVADVADVSGQDLPTADGPTPPKKRTAAERRLDEARRRLSHFTVPDDFDEDPPF